MRGHHRTPVAASIYNFSPLSQRRSCVGRGSCCSLVTGCRFIHIHIHAGAYIAIPRVWMGCCLLLLVDYTYQAILVLLPKLTNAPTKVHIVCLAHRGSGVYHAVHFFYVQCTFFIAGCSSDYTSSSTLTHLHTYIS